jgi:hypothetical protein
MEPTEDELREFFNLVGEHKLVKRFIALRQVLDAARPVVDDPSPANRAGLRATINTYDLARESN